MRQKVSQRGYDNISCDADARESCNSIKICKKPSQYKKMIDSGRIFTLLRERHRKPFYYAGVGDGSPSTEILDLIGRATKELAEAGCTLRSGGGEIVDEQFELNATAKEVILPYLGFNKNPSQLIVDPSSLSIAKSVHTAWSRCSEFAKFCHARNVQVLLGQDLVSPVSLVICYSEDGAWREDQVSARTGYMRTLIALANRRGIPVLNLRRSMHVNLLCGALQINRPTTAVSEIQ